MNSFPPLIFDRENERFGPVGLCVGTEMKCEDAKGILVVGLII